MSQQLLRIIKQRQARSLNNKVNSQIDFLQPILGNKKGKQLLSKGIQCDPILPKQYTQPALLDDRPRSHTYNPYSKVLRTQESQQMISKLSNNRDSTKKRQKTPYQQEVYQLSPEKRQKFKIKLRNIDEQIKCIQKRHNQFDQSEVNGLINQMLNKWKHTLQQPNKSISPQKEDSQDYDINQSIIQKSFGQHSESRRKQRSILRNSTYYKSSEWQNKKKQIIKNLIEMGWYKRRQFYSKIKFPFYRDGSKQLFRYIRQKNYQDVLKLLTQNKYLVYEVDTSQQSPLHVSAQFGLYDITKVLLRFDHDVNCVDSQGKTPLFYAVANCHIELMKLLIAYDAKPWSYLQCNYTQFFSNPKLKQVIKISQRVRTLLMFVPKRLYWTVKDYLEQLLIPDYKLPSTLYQ